MGTFSNLPLLGELYLSDNSISSIDADAFLGLDNLSYIVLNNNLLTSIPSAVRGLPNLQMLSLENNHITSLNADSFVGLSNVFSLKLQGNDISAVSDDTFKDIQTFWQPGAGARLCLGLNPLNCCGLEWLRDLEALDFLCDLRATCSGPVHLKGVALKDTSGVIACDA